jgi:hypothetical protein
MSEIEMLDACSLTITKYAAMSKQAQEMIVFSNPWELWTSPKCHQEYQNKLASKFVLFVLFVRRQYPRNTKNKLRLFI